MSKQNMERKIQAVEPIIKLGYSIENSLIASIGATISYQSLENVLVTLDEISSEVTACVSSFLYNVHVDYKAEFDYFAYLRQSDISPFLYWYYNRINQVMNKQIRTAISEQENNEVQQRLISCFKEVCEVYNQEFDPTKSNEPFDNKHYKYQMGITNDIKAVIQSRGIKIPNHNLEALFNDLDRCENEISEISALCGDPDGWYEVYYLWDRAEELFEEHLQEVLYYNDYMQIRNKVLDLLQRKCDELDLMNKFEYYGEILRRKSLKRVQSEQKFIESNYEKENYGIKCDWREIVNNLNGGV